MSEFQADVITGCAVTGVIFLMMISYHVEATYTLLRRKLETAKDAKEE